MLRAVVLILLFRITIEENNSDESKSRNNQ
jgi:hypothetical protein